jgi:hypothetical protein
MEVTMRLIRVSGVVLLLAAAACAAPQVPAPLHGSGSPLIDEPVAPFPYNSKFCT